MVAGYPTHGREPRAVYCVVNSLKSVTKECMHMAGPREAEVPQSPETQPPDVRDELDQTQITHDGPERDGDTGTAPSAHLGAVEDEVTPVQPPMRGPDDLVGNEDQGELVIDPADEITPG